MGPVRGCFDQRRALARLRHSSYETCSIRLSCSVSFLLACSSARSAPPLRPHTHYCCRRHPASPAGRLLASGIAPPSHESVCVCVGRQKERFGASLVRHRRALRKLALAAVCVCYAVHHGEQRRNFLSAAMPQCFHLPAVPCFIAGASCWQPVSCVRYADDWTFVRRRIAAHGKRLVRNKALQVDIVQTW